MSQEFNELYNERANKKSNKRKYNDLDNLVEDILVDENLNFIDPEEDEDEDSKKTKKKNFKFLSSGNNNLHTLRHMRLIKKQKENTNTISQEQLDFAKKVVEQNNKNNSIEKEVSIKEAINNNKLSKKLQIASNITFTIQNKPSINNIINNKTNEEDILYYFGCLNGCEYKIIDNNTQIFKVQITINKNEEVIVFTLNFNKTDDEYKDIVEFIPIKNTFKLKGEDSIFYDELEIPKEDIGKIFKRLLIYKYSPPDKGKEKGKDQLNK